MDPHIRSGQKQDDQLEHTSSSYVRIQDVALKTYQRRWTIGRSGERGSGISVPVARHDDDDDDGQSVISDCQDRNWFSKIRSNDTSLTRTLIRTRSRCFTRKLALDMNTSQSTIYRHLKKISEIFFFLAEKLPVSQEY